MRPCVFDSAWQSVRELFDVSSSLSTRHEELCNASDLIAREMFNMQCNEKGKHIAKH